MSTVHDFREEIADIKPLMVKADFKTTEGLKRTAEEDLNKKEAVRRSGKWDQYAADCPDVKKNEETKVAPKETKNEQNYVGYSDREDSVSEYDISFVIGKSKCNKPIIDTGALRLIISEREL